MKTIPTETIVEIVKCYNVPEDYRPTAALVLGIFIRACLDYQYLKEKVAHWPRNKRGRCATLLKFYQSPDDLKQLAIFLLQSSKWRVFEMLGLDDFTQRSLTALRVRGDDVCHT